MCAKYPSRRAYTRHAARRGHTHCVWRARRSCVASREARDERDTHHELGGQADHFLHQEDANGYNCRIAVRVEEVGDEELERLWKLVGRP